MVICVCVLVFVGYLEVINLEFEFFILDEEVCDILREVLGCLVVDNCEDEGYVMFVDCVGDFVMFISCVWKDFIVENGFNLWVVLDNF